MAIFITGDTHGDFSRLAKGAFPELDALTENDSVIICGDFGGVWNGGTEEEAVLDRLNDRPFTTLFVSGNHENFDLLAKYPRSEWHGGLVHRIRPKIIHLLRGQVFALEDKTFFTMGGASSHDISDGILELDDPLLERKVKRLYRSGALFRVNHLTWWKEELPSAEEYQTARENLERHDWAVDYIITHCAPTSVQKALFPEHSYHPDALTDFLEEVRERCRFHCWFFGHYHRDRAIGNQFALLYEQMIEL